MSHPIVYSRNIREKAADTKCLKDVFKDFKLLCRRTSAKKTILSSEQMSVCTGFLKNVHQMRKKMNFRFKKYTFHNKTSIEIKDVNVDMKL